MTINLKLPDIRELKPSSVYDLAAMVALFRPGPMDNIPAYIRRKHGQEPVTYLHPLLEPYLEKTYGIFVYQEDIMAAAIALGGFTGPEADTLGYAIRKKKSAVLRAQKETFVQRADGTIWGWGLNSSGALGIGSDGYVRSIMEVTR